MDNWEGWAAVQGMLQNGQIWENNDVVFQIDKAGKKYRVVMFAVKNEELQYVGIVFYDEEEKLCHFLESMNMRPTSKFLTIGRH